MSSRWRLPARASDQGFLPIETTKYIMLLDWTGRELHRDKRGAIPDSLAPILERLGIDRSNWVNTVRDFGRMFKQAAGRASSLARAAPRYSRRGFRARPPHNLPFSERAAGCRAMVAPWQAFQSHPSRALPFALTAELT